MAQAHAGSAGRPARPSLAEWNGHSKRHRVEGGSGLRSPLTGRPAAERIARAGDEAAEHLACAEALPPETGSAELPGFRLGLCERTIETLPSHA